MPYNRKMPDWSIKVYYTIEEMDIMLKECIDKNANDLLHEIKEEKLKKEQVIIYKEYVYA